MVTDDKTGDSPMLEKLLGTVVGPQAEEPQVDSDYHMELISGMTDPVKDSLPATESFPINMLATGISSLALLGGGIPSSHGAYLLADSAYASLENM